MRGVRRRIEREEEATLAQAHLTAAFGRIERLHPLPHWLGRLRAAREAPRGASSILNTLMALADGGHMTVTATPRGAPQE